MRVLIADDSEMILERLGRLIEVHRQAELVGKYNNGTDTLDALRNLKPDLAIVDYKMPGLSGLEVLSEIRKEDKVLKFIVLTFYAVEYIRQMAIQAGADYFFSKVDGFEELDRVLDELMEEGERNKDSELRNS